MLLNKSNFFNKLRQNREFFINFITALTAAHLCLLPVWELAVGGTPRLFLIEDSVGNIIVEPLIILSLLLTLIGFFSLHFYYKNNTRIVGITWTLIIFIASASLCRIFIFSLFIRKISMIAASPKIKMAIMALFLLGILGCLLWLGLLRWVHITQKIVMVLSPLLIFIWVQLLFNRPIEKLIIKPSIETTNKNIDTIWILVFDELDEKIIEDLSQTENLLNEFKEWRNFSTNCTNAFPPTGSTLHSIPAMIHGRQMVNSQGDGDYEFSPQNVTKEGEKIKWDWSDSLFSDIRRQGGKSAVIGWCFPYAPFYSTSVDSIDWVSPKAGQSGFSVDKTLLRLMGTITRETIIGPISYVLMSNVNRSLAHGKAVDKIDEYLDALVDRPPLDFVWVHYPVPHSPAVDGPQGTYLDNLKVVDNELYKFRKRLSDRGRFTEATVVVTGDHWFRKPSAGSPFTRGFENRWDQKNHRVPFLLKLPNQSTSSTHSRGFNTIILRKLVNAIYRGEIKSVEKFKLFLDQHTPYQESPITMNNF